MTTPTDAELVRRAVRLALALPPANRYASAAQRRPKPLRVQPRVRRG